MNALNKDVVGLEESSWRDLIALVRQPALRMLQIDEQTPLKAAFQAWERHIRSSGALQSPDEWVPVYDAEACPVSEEDFRTLLDEVQRLVDGLNRHWLLRGYTEPGSGERIAPTGIVQPPEAKP